MSKAKPKPGGRKTKPKPAAREKTGRKPAARKKTGRKSAVRKKTKPKFPEIPEVVRQLLEGSTDAAVVLTDDRRLVYHNAVYERYCSMRPRELARAVSEGAHCYDVFPVEVCRTECVLRQAQKAGRPIRMDEIHAKRADGEELTLIVTAAPLGDALTVESYRDVTADARMQANYKELLKAEREARENLEKEVDQRTEELRRANEELKRAQAMLIHQETMSSLGRLVAGIAHELNNPINFVYGNIDFMEEYMERLMRLVNFYEELTGPEHPHLGRIRKIREEIEYDFLCSDVAKLIQSIRHGAERTAAIVRDLKTFSRPDTAEMRRYDLIKGIESTLSLLHSLIKDRITVVKDYQTLPRVLCHPAHINQVFMNILTNAAEAIEGEGEIVIRTRAVKDGVRIIIKDSGPGIPYEHLSRLFEPFFTTKSVGKGTGLGLSICEGIVRHHGGRIAVESRLGEGSVFSVELPLEPPKEVQDEAGWIG